LVSALPRKGGWRELAAVISFYAILTVVLIAPLAFSLGSVARLDNADTRHIIWNVAWVARTLVLDPLNVYNTNIFYPHPWTLAYSEHNLGAGILAILVYWATGNPYAAHNFVVLASFVLSGTATYYLVRYVTGDRRAAAIGGICFAFCPYALSHLPHVHLLMTAGLPLCMLAFHRLADRPTLGRGAALGLAMGAQTLFCGYYGVFVGLTVGYAALGVAAARRLWTNARYWGALAAGAVVTVAIALPLFVPYLRLQRETGFSRPLADARQYSAHWRTYFASSAYAHAWMLPLIRRWNEVLFPGFIALAAGGAGFISGWLARGRLRESAILYGGLAAVAFWLSLGPDAGLYLALTPLPAFTIMRAPSRFGAIVAFALCVLAGMGIAMVLDRVDRRSARAATSVAVGLAIFAVVELATPLSFSRVPPVEPGYRVLATLPRGPLIELPWYSNRFAAARTQYVLNSTSHWMPLVNGYSSHTPRQFLDETPVLAGFPSIDAFRILERDRVRYAMFHMTQFTSEARQDLESRLRQFDRYLARRHADERLWLYEIVEYPR
jgi:hypothetical protein